MEDFQSWLDVETGPSNQDGADAKAKQVAATKVKTEREVATRARPDLRKTDVVGTFQETTKEAAQTEPWKQIGDHKVAMTWHSSLCWGAEVALSVEEGDLVSIDLVDSQGWAHAIMKGNKQGWLPYAVLHRVVHCAKTYFSEDTYEDYLLLKPNDEVVVYSQQQDGERLWCYGGQLKAGTNVIEQVGWFPAEVIA